MKRGNKEIFEWIKALAIAVIIAIVIRSFLFTNYVVEGKSMMPTLQDGNRLIVNKIDYNFELPDRFDIVIFHANAEEDYVKRVIGLPGDTIKYQDDQLYVNGEKIPEPYLKPYKSKLISGTLTENFTLEMYTGENEVPEGKLFVMGDNRRESVDSRRFGFVDMEQVVGEVNLRYWPVSEIDWMN